MKMFLRCFLLALVFNSFNAVFAQLVVKGKITDSDGQRWSLQMFVSTAFM